jgi:hypothetical protein
MCKSLAPLRVTTPTLHRFWITLSSVNQWYAVMHDLRQEFGKNWKTQPRARRRLLKTEWSIQNSWCLLNDNATRTKVWFDVPDLRIASWLSLKYGTVVLLGDTNNGK